MKTYKCTMCNYTVSTDESGSKAYQKIRHRLGEHYDTKHKDQLPDGMDGYRYLYFLLTGKERGSCIICHQPTEFNNVTMKYARFCDNPACKQVYREERDRRVMAKYGKLYVTDDPEFQRKMLANRKISGTYIWSDGTEFQYVGTYEKDFLELLDKQLHWASGDIMMPSPNTYYYDYNGKQHFYCPDVYLVPYNLEIEIKSSARMDNQNPESREKEILKDELMKSLPNVNYIRIMDKDYKPFLDYINDDKNRVIEIKTESVYITEENNKATTFKLFDQKLINAIKDKSKKALVGVERFVNIVINKVSSDNKKVKLLAKRINQLDYTDENISKLSKIFNDSLQVATPFVPMRTMGKENIINKDVPDDIRIGTNTALSNNTVSAVPFPFNGNKRLGLISYDQIVDGINSLIDSQDYIYKNLSKAYQAAFKEDINKGVELNINKSINILEQLVKLPDLVINKHSLAFPLNHQGFKMDKEEYLQYIQDNIKSKGNSDHASYNQEILAINDIVTGEQLNETLSISPMIVQNLLSLGITRVIQTTQLNPVTLKIVQAYAKTSDVGITKLKVGDIDTVPRFKSTVNYTNVTNVKNQLDNRFMKQAMSEFLPNEGELRINNIDVTRSSIDYNGIDKLAMGLPLKQLNAVYINPLKKQAIEELNKRLNKLHKELVAKGINISNPTELQKKMYHNEFLMMQSLYDDIQTIYSSKEKYDKSIMDKYRDYDITHKFPLSDDEDNDTINEAKELKYDYRIEYDVKTGHQLLIQYSLDNIIVTDTGASFFYLSRSNRDGINKYTGKYDHIEDMPNIIRLVQLASISLINTYKGYYKYRNYVIDELTKFFERK